MNPLFRIGLLCALAMSCFLVRPASSAEFSSFVRRIPADVNILVMVDVDRLLDSPYARKQGWKKQLAENPASRPILLPPKAKKLMRAIAMDLNSSTENWEIAILEAEKGISLKKIAEKQQGYVEKISDTETAWLPQGAYGVKLQEDVFAFLFPANRQFLSRWLRARSGQIATYLLSASSEMNSKAQPQVTVAIDLEDLVESGALEERLRGFEALQHSVGNLSEIARVIHGLRGAKLTVDFAEQPRASLIIEFSSDAAPLKAVAKPLILEALANRGLAIDEADNWDASTRGKQVIFEGSLGASGILRLSSLVELPSSLIQDTEEETDAENPVLYATQNHYKAVQALLADLFGRKDYTFGQYAQWAENYAKKIDRLPLLNVDTDMQAYSAQIADLLRQGAVAFKGVGIRSGGRQKQVWNSNYVTYGYYGARNYDAGAQERRAIRGQETAKGAMDLAEMKRQIDEATGDIRRTMVERYKVEF